MRRYIPLILSLLALLAVLSPFAFVLGFSVLTPPAYQDTFVGALDDKFERLNSIKTEKIVVIGGSSVAFGLDSALLEKYTGMPIVNFGLYASLGTKLMLDLSLSGIGRGDVVVISPEMNKEALSLFFNADTAWRAIEDDVSMLRYIGFDNISEMLAGAFDYSLSKLETQKVDTGNQNTVYLSKYFNEYGDFCYPRAENVLTAYYDKNTPIELNSDAYGEELSEFFDYVNSYVRKCRLRGAEVYFSFAPMNELALTERSGESERALLEEYFRESLDCELITTLDGAIYAPGYFFDTNFHLNSKGAAARTLNLARELKLALGITSGIVEEPPAPPALPEAEVRFDGYDENSKYFTYEKLENGAFAITGLSELGIASSELTVPLGYSGYKVISVQSCAFSGTALESLKVSADSNLVIFENGAFVGASHLSHLWMYNPDAGAVSPPIDFAGTDSDFVVHVPELSDYGYHYSWGERHLTFVYDAN